MDSLNSILASAHDPYKHIGYTAMSILTLYINTLFVESHYQKVRNPLSTQSLHSSSFLSRADPAGNGQIRREAQSRKPRSLQPRRTQFPQSLAFSLSIREYFSAYTLQDILLTRASTTARAGVLLTSQALFSFFRNSFGRGFGFVVISCSMQYSSLLPYEPERARRS